MRPDRDDLYVTDESLSDLAGSRRTHLKLFGAGTIVGLALAVATFQQFARGRSSDVPVATQAEASDVPAVERTVFGDGPSQTPSPSQKMSRDVTVEASQEKTPLQAAVPVQKQEPSTRNRAEVPQLTGRNIQPSRDLPPEFTYFLNRWRDTMISGDMNAQANLYAGSVSRFFTKQNVSRNEVRREKESLLAKYPALYRYEIGDVRLESMRGDQAVITFRKDWDARGRGRYAGSERQKLTLSKASGDWKIVGEEEVKVYWVRRT